VPAFSGVVRRGLLRAERIVRDGSRVILAIEAPGALVGDWAGPAGSPALAAASDAELCVFDPGSVRALLATDPEARRHVLRDIDARCERQNDMIWRRGALSAAERIASVLVTPGLAVPLRHRPDGGLEVRVVLSRPDWADLAGTTVESVCRTMAGLAERGLVERLAPGRYLIRDAAALAAPVVVPAAAAGARTGWPDTGADA
jgi:CRP/FNR family transcriptional regulator